MEDSQQGFTEVDADAIQSHVLLGHHADVRAALFISFVDEPGGPPLEALLELVTSVSDLLRDDGAGLCGEGALALTREGVQYIRGRISPGFDKGDYGGYGGIDAPFWQGAHGRAANVGDTNVWLRSWRFGWDAPATHAVLLLARWSAEEMDEAILKVTALPGLKIIARQDGVSARRGPLGFRDGIQRVQARIRLRDGRKLPSAPRPTAMVSADRLFVRQEGVGRTFKDDFAVRRAQWANLGSFLVLRRYRTSRDHLAHVAKTLVDAGTPLERAEAQVIGRWRNGTSLGESASAPTLGPPTALDVSADADGARCPLRAHARMMRDEDGSPYPIFRRSFRGDEPDVLVFVSYQASIKVQFEGLMDRATRSPKRLVTTSVAPVGPDALLGADTNWREPLHSRVVVDPRGKRHVVPAVAVCEGMLYAITPSLRTLRCWARGELVDDVWP